VIGGRNKYLIDGLQAQQNRVQNLFHSVQLNVNNPHFLIMQGRITKVVSMKPMVARFLISLIFKEILAMLEEATGTRMFEVQKLNVQKTLAKKDSKVKEIQRVLDEEIIPQVELLRKQRAHYMKWTNNQREIDQLSRFTVAYEYMKEKVSIFSAEPLSKGSSRQFLHRRFTNGRRKIRIRSESKGT
jgi:structural maintenance of chromosome 2